MSERSTDIFTASKKTSSRGTKYEGAVCGVDPGDDRSEGRNVGGVLLIEKDQKVLDFAITVLLWYF